MSDDRVCIVGAGRAGRGLARALRASGVAVVGLRARRAPPHDPDGATTDELATLVRRATVVLLAVQDAALPAAVADVVAAAPHAATAVLQLSGSADDSLLSALRRRGHPAGTFHPLVPLADPARAPALLRGAWVGLGGDPGAVEIGRRLAAALGAHTLDVPAELEARARYHAAAVFASNFPVVLAALAERLLAESGVAPDAARGAVSTLLRAATENLAAEGPSAALTGPVARGDAGTVRRHLAALGGSVHALAAYRALSAAALELKRGALAPTVAAELEGALESAPSLAVAGVVAP